MFNKGQKMVTKIITQILCAQISNFPHDCKVNGFYIADCDMKELVTTSIEAAKEMLTQLDNPKKRTKKKK